MLPTRIEISSLKECLRVPGDKLIRMYARLYLGNKLRPPAGSRDILPPIPPDKLEDFLLFNYNFAKITLKSLRVDKPNRPNLFRAILVTAVDSHGKPTELQ